MSSSAEPQFLVVLNHELQYSIWPHHKELPLGWSETGVEGSKEHCLEHIEKVWVDMRPVGVRIHLERLERERVDRGEERIKPPSAPEAELLGPTQGYKLTDRDGLCFRSEKQEYGVGQTLQAKDFDREPYPGGGLHFSRSLEDSVANGLAAAVWDDRYFEELKDDYLSSSRLHQDGVRLFRVAAEEAVVITDSVCKAPSLKVVEEINLSESALWPLVVAYRAWELEQTPALAHP